jgi:DNA-directed RNA polymerase specialized sigma24 family protein
VQAALEHLSPNQRTVFLMRFAEEMDLSEIAAVTRMPINTVKTHLHRALKSVRAQVGSLPGNQPSAVSADASPANDSERRSSR